MQPRHLLISLLILVHILLGLVVCPLGKMLANTLRDNSGSILLLISVSASQIGLLSIWLALGRRAAPWRLTALVATIVGWSWLEWLVLGRWHQRGVFFFLMSSLSVCLILAVARFFGLQLHNKDVETTEENNLLQFTLGRLFAWTTSLAICLGLLSPTIHYCADTNAHNLLGVFVFSSIEFAIILVCLWATLTDLGWRLLVVLLLIIVFSQPVIFVIKTHELRQLLTFYVQQIPLVVGSLMVCRVAGYRLKWKRKNSRICPK